MDKDGNVVQIEEEYFDLLVDVRLNPEYIFGVEKVGSNTKIKTIIE